MIGNNVADAIHEYQYTKDSVLGSELIAHFEGLVYAACHSFYMDGQERDDMLQEGRIGLFKALRDYRPTCGASFTSFAVRCIRCQCISAIKAAHRCKHRILNQALSLDVTIYEDNEHMSWLDGLVDERVLSPMQSLISYEDYERCQRIFEQIYTPFDYDIFLARLYGESYEQIAHRMGRNIKAIDNALQRCRRRLLCYISEHDDLDAAALEHFFSTALELHAQPKDAVQQAS